jgi:hypothetical protein
MFIFSEEEESLPEGTRAVTEDTRSVRFNHPSQTLMVTDIAKFIREPVPIGLILSCVVRRSFSGLLSKTLKFDVSLDNEKRVLASAVEIEMNKFTVLASGKDTLTAIVESNFIGTEFRVLSGVSKNAVELAFIEYDVNILGLSGPRKMTVYTPKLDPATRLPVSFPVSKKTLKDLFQAGHPAISKFKSKEPDLDPVTGIYSLEFYGRAKVPSVKNFILRAEDPLHF